MMRKGLIIFSTLIFMLFAFKANAQLQNGDISLEVNPPYPKANENVTASLSTFTTDLNTAKISWKKNGETLLEGIGKKTFSFTIDSASSKTNLQAIIETLNGSVVNKQITIYTSGVDLLWEANNTYTPPFYKGKALAPIEGNIKVVAIPSAQNAAGFSYKWKQDNQNKLDYSGYEKNYLIYKNSYLDQNNKVEVVISDLFGNDIGSNNITITPTSPKIIFYEKDSLFGTKWEKSLTDGFKINPNGTTIIAEPYFFSIKDLNSKDYSFEWLLNDQDASKPNQKNSLSVKPESGSSGSSNIKITINNIPTLFQSVEKELNVNF
jgi:hypothetical protein